MKRNLLVVICLTSCAVWCSNVRGAELEKKDGVTPRSQYLPSSRTSSIASDTPGGSITDSAEVAPQKGAQVLTNEQIADLRIADDLKKRKLRERYYSHTLNTTA